MKVKGSVIKAVLVAIVALGYGVSPVDVISDFIPGLGLTDDGLVLVTAAVVIVRIILKSRGLRQRDGGSATTGS